MSRQSRSHAAPVWAVVLLLALFRAVIPAHGQPVGPATSATPAAAGGARPNLIVVMSDDQAAWSVGAYGNRESRTPNIDRLAREGARFTNAFVATPVCSPSRASFFTGRWGTELGITDWIAPVEARRGVGLAAEALTWPEVLQHNGYRTALVGKWHLGMQPPFHPTNHGFDHFFGFVGGGTRPIDPTLERDGEPVQLTGPTPDLLTDDAIRFVSDHRERPFALCLFFRAPHLPYRPVPPADAEPFAELDPAIPSVPGLDEKQVKDWTRDYYASVHSVDRNLGRLLASLDEIGIASRTIVVFTSDHGYNIGHHGLHTKGNGSWIVGGQRGPKRPNMFDTSLRVPLIVRWPGTTQPGTEIPQLVTNLDTFASVLGMLDIPAPGDAARQHGQDFSPLLRGQPAAAWRRELFAQYDLHNGGLAYMRMIRTPRWKLVRHHFANHLDELYDLEADPDEARNLYAEPSARTTRDDLQARLTAWQQSIQDPILNDPRTTTAAAAAAGGGGDSDDKAK